MTKCTCCHEEVWVMHSPATCQACLDAACDPKFYGQTTETDFGSVFLVEGRANPCRRER